MTAGWSYRFVGLGLCLLALTAASPQHIIELHATLEQSRDQRVVFSTQYLGSVRSVPIPLGTGGSTEWGPIAYDAKRDAIYIAYNSTGNVLLVRLRMNGAVTPIASLPSMPTSLTYDPTNDTLYSTDQSRFVVYSISQRGLVLPLAGGTQGTQDGQGRTAQFQGPQGVTVEPSTGNLFVADVDRVRRVTRSGVVTTISPPGGFGPNALNGSNAQPEGIAFDPVNHGVFVTDSYQQKIWKVAARNVRLLTGQCVNRCDALQRDGSLGSALLGWPSGAIFNPVAKTLYFADTANNQVRTADANGVRTLAGSGAAGFADGLGYKAQFYFPTSVALDTKTGDLIVLDTFNNALRFITTVGSPPPPPLHGITMYDPPTAASGPLAIALGVDGSLWFTETLVNKIGRLMPDGSFKEYAGAAGTSSFGRIVLGGDENMWYAANGPSGAEIDRIQPDGEIAQFPVHPPANYYQVVDLVLGADGNIWFCENYGAIGVMTPSGSYTIYLDFDAGYLANGLGGTLWLANYGSLEQISTAPALLRQINLPIALGNLTLGPDGNMWVGQPGALLKVTDKAVLKYLLPTTPDGQTIYVGDLAIGLDQHIWFAESDGSIGRLTTRGSYGKFLVPAPRSGPSGMIAAPDGSIWFSDFGAQKIGRYH